MIELIKKYGLFMLLVVMFVFQLIVLVSMLIGG